MKEGVFMYFRSFLKICLACVLFIALNIGLQVSASANNTDNSNEAQPFISLVHNHSLKATPVDKTDSVNGFHVTVNVANTTSIFAFCNDPVYWTLEWQILKDDHTIYTTGRDRVGVFYNTIASQSEDFFAGALKSGYFRYRLSMVSHGVTTVSEWDEIYASPHGGHGGGGRPRSICLQM